MCFRDDRLRDDLASLSMRSVTTRLALDLFRDDPAPG
jgi:hypothetical protein